MTYGSSAIYLDHAATTPVDPRVVEVMLPYFTQTFGNPSSLYGAGQDAHAALSYARRTMSNALGARPTEVLFTSGATESANLAIKGVAWAAKRRNPDHNPHVLVSAIEHHAVLHAAESLVDIGFSMSTIPVDADGHVDGEELKRLLRPETCLVSVMYANNEIGTVQDIAKLSRIAHDHGVPFHTDAVQAAGSLPLAVDHLGVDLLTLSAHKFYGPKGVGLLYVRKGIAIQYQQDGGGQESGRRGGTENVALIFGMAEALRLAEEGRNAFNQHSGSLRNRLWTGMRDNIPDIQLNGPAFDGPRLSNNLNVSIRGVQGETVLLGLDLGGVAASAGSACTTGNSEPSHVLLATGGTEDQARESLRLTVGRGNSEAEIDEVVNVLKDVVERTRALSGSTT